MELKQKIINYIIRSSNKIKINSNEIKKNDIFLALQGKKSHGNQYINNAIKSGAKYCISDKKTNSNNYKIKILLVEDCLSFMKDLSVIKRSLYKGKVIGITGSAGKTTLKENLKFYLKKKFKVSASIKSYNNNLGVLLSILNMDLKSNFSIFEIGTNNFGEIRSLTYLLKPSQILITNILSTHLESFKNKKNIANEKSDIFIKKYNPLSKILFFYENSKVEETIYKIAKKQQLKKIVKIGSNLSDCYIKNICNYKFYFEIDLVVLNRSFVFKFNSYEDYQLINLLFILAFLIVNKINPNIVINSKNKFFLVEGRGSKHNLIINKYNVQFIDQSYNANPETMIQSIINFSKMKKTNYLKILILGNMNELGLKFIHHHIKVIKEVEKHRFDEVILCGDFLKKALNVLSNLKNKYVYKNNTQTIMSYLEKNIHKKAIMMAKCSNNTEVNHFSKLIKLKKAG